MVRADCDDTTAAHHVVFTRQDDPKYRGRFPIRTGEGQGTVIRIGRSPDCQVSLGYRGISSYHLEIRLAAHASKASGSSRVPPFLIRDLSMNGAEVRSADGSATELQKCVECLVGDGSTIVLPARFKNPGDAALQTYLTVRLEKPSKGQHVAKALVASDCAIVVEDAGDDAEDPFAGVQKKKRRKRRPEEPEERQSGSPAPAPTREKRRRKDAQPEWIGEWISSHALGLKTRRPSETLCVERVRYMYATYNPSKLPQLESVILQKYKGSEFELFEAMCEKYLIAEK